MQLEVIDTYTRLQEVKADWAELIASLPSVTPFQTPEWLLPWWQHFGSGDLQVLLFRDGSGSLAGLLPCFRHEWNGHRQLTLIGSGISDYLEPPIAPSYRETVTRCLVDFLRSDPSWGVCDWQDLSCGTPLSSVVAPGEFDAGLQADLPCSEIPITDGFVNYWAERPSGLRRNVRRYREKAEQIGRVEFSASNLNQESLEALIRLHSARWREQGEPGMIAANRSANFLRQAARELERSQSIIFFSLTFQGGISAVIMAFPFRNTLYGYLSAFDPAYGSLGFGRILLFESLRYAFENKYAAWNFLRGSEPYKADWGACPIPKARIIIRRDLRP